ncbi:D-alanyl-D-alanine carboxypeptidase [Candidatus Shapirobacteria bacterium]|nr:D-alanyl-D-alanine carboxypeptidase [Candidatus Shapirobacteria bacterium]
MPKSKPHRNTFLVLTLAGIVLLSLLNLTVWGLRLSPGARAESSTLLFSDFHHPDTPVVKLAPKPSLLTNSYVLIDTATNQVLLSQNQNERIYPASTTKLATALTALNIYPLDEVITIGSTYSDGKVMELVTGEKITVKSLVTALLIYSANDAAYNLANHHQNGVSGFVAEMNNLVKKYQLAGTHFTNFDGIDNPAHYSTAIDLAQIGRLAIRNSVIRETVKNKKITVADITGKSIHQLESTNELLDVVPEIRGLKTGWTPDAGGSFVALIDLNGHELISVVTRSDDRFGDTIKLINWAKSNLSYRPYSP